MLPEEGDAFKTLEQVLERYKVQTKTAAVEIIDCDPSMSIEALAANIRPHPNAGAVP